MGIIKTNDNFKEKEEKRNTTIFHWGIIAGMRLKKYSPVWTTHWMTWKGFHESTFGWPIWYFFNITIYLLPSIFLYLCTLHECNPKTLKNEQHPRYSRFRRKHLWHRPRRHKSTPQKAWLKAMTMVNPSLIMTKFLIMLIIGCLLIK